MNLICFKNILLDALEKAKSCTSRSLPICQHFLLEASDDKLSIATTNLETSIKVFCDADIKEKGSICAPDKLFSIIKQAPDERIFIRVREKNLFIDSGKSHFRLAGLEKDEFPEMYVKKGELEIDLLSFLKGLKKVAFAAEISNYGHLNSIYCSSGMAVATDGRRLAKTEINGIYKALIPISAVRNILSIFAGVDKALLSINENRLHLSTDDIQFATQLMDANFPDWQTVIPKKFTTKVKINRKSFIDTIQRVSLINNDFATKFEIKDKKVLVSSASSIGESKEEIPAETNGEITIAFNAKFLIEGIRVINSDEIIMKFVDKVSPCVIEPVNSTDSDKGYMYIVMPLQLRSEE